MIFIQLLPGFIDFIVRPTMNVLGDMLHKIVQALSETGQRDKLIDGGDRITGKMNS